MAYSFHNVESDWITQLPIGWEIRPLKWFASSGSGISFTKADLVEEGNAVISYGQVHAKNNPQTFVIDDLIRYIPDELIQDKEKALCNMGDFIFADTSEDLAGCGNCVFIDRDSIIYAGYHTIRLQNKSLKNGRFFAYQFMSDNWRKQIRSRVKAVKTYSVAQTILNQTSVIIPPADVQKAIVDYLDKECGRIGQEIELLERKADAYRRLRRSIINQAVTRGLNPNVKMVPSGNKWIGDIPEHWKMERVQYHFHSNTEANKDYEFQSAFKSYMGTIVPKNEEFDAGDFPETYEKYTKVKKDDIIINGLNLNYDLKSMRVAIVPYDGILTSAYLVLRPFEGENANFFNYLFKAFDNRKFFHGMGSGVRLTLAFKELKAFEIPIPPMSEQSEIVDFLDDKCSKIETIVSKITEKIEKLKALKRSLINEVVTGQRAII